MRQNLKNIIVPFSLLAILFAFCTWLGYLSGQTYPKESAKLFQKALQDFSILKNINAPTMFAFIFFNNAIKSFAVVALGFFFGIIPILFIAINGILLGLTASVIIKGQGIVHLLVGILPHGVLEVPALLIASAYGVQLGRRYYFKLRYKYPFTPAFYQAMKNTAKYVLPLLLVASLIETFLTTALLKAV